MGVTDKANDALGKARNFLAGNGNKMSDGTAQALKEAIDKVQGLVDTVDDGKWYEKTFDTAHLSEALVELSTRLAEAALEAA